MFLPLYLPLLQFCSHHGKLKILTILKQAQILFMLGSSTKESCTLRVPSCIFYTGRITGRPFRYLTQLSM
jgi:hypothetical protein